MRQAAVNAAQAAEQHATPTLFMLRHSDASAAPTFFPLRFSFPISQRIRVPPLKSQISNRQFVVLIIPKGFRPPAQGCDAPPFCVANLAKVPVNSAQP